MSKYFENVRTRKELVKAYRKLAKKLHPDCGGNAEEFKAMSAEFNALLAALPDTDAGYTEAASHDSSIPAEMAVVLEKVIHMDGIEIEICGSWIWVSGNTYPVKDTLRAAGFSFSGSKKMWYWHSGEYRKKSRKSLDMNAIRELHGSVAVQTKRRMAIA